VGLDHLLSAYPRAHHMLASLRGRKLLEDVQNDADIKRLMMEAHRARRETALRGVARKTEASEPIGLPKRKEAPLDELLRSLCEPYNGRRPVPSWFVRRETYLAQFDAQQ
jgi:hypothetical protein